MPKYLEKRRRRWLAVLDVPKALREKLGKARFVKSLETESLTEAERLKLPLIAMWKAEIEAARTGDRKPIEDLLQTAASWGADFRSLTGQERREALWLIEDKVEDIAYRDEQLAADFAKVARSESVETLGKLDAWLASLSNEPKTKDMKRSDLQRFAKTFPYTHKATRFEVQRWVHSLEQDDGLKTATVRRIVSACRGYWHYLQASGAIAEEIDPFVKAVPRKAKVSKAEHASRRRHLIPLDVVHLLEGAAAKGDSELVHLIWIAMWTGCRIEEICALTVANARADHLFIEDAKSPAGNREVPIHSRLEPVLEKLKASSTDGYVISGLTFNKYKDRSNAIGKRFGRLKSSLGFGPQHVFHSIRKTVATELENAGVPENVAADILGHDKPNITFGLYSGGTSLANKQVAIEKLHYPKANIAGL
ncbi:tyrosine-type recombinase/integrase [Cereibacter sphaeroides]|uniref:tyrosine-type recombinase/integrase n=1 Tax=Cereibacter sphaeroides TaxID=1063 RepID=UPI001F411F15|nr:tyrosine-type recombinase/integrase [Cereibacter sphaeroides]MCE6957595.1 tyrosine-type recombinase/integrase [Cereibacter sphaeroides]MCE6971128.1 tyrosine-type recombinase/integrase [Cereibacter sphaeroides]